METHDMPIENDATVHAKAVYRRAGPIPMAPEEYGSFARGENGFPIAAGSLGWRTGDLARNTSGGLLADAYPHGPDWVIEGVRQMRQTSTYDGGARISAIFSGGHGSAAILER